MEPPGSVDSYIGAVCPDRILADRTTIVKSQAAAGDFRGAGLRRERRRHGQHDESCRDAAQVGVDRRKRPDDGQLQSDQ